MTVATSRLQEVYGNVIAALRQLVRDQRLTEDELHAAAEFLNRVGAAGEFPLLFDITLAVTSVDVTKGAAGGTPANILGPYYLPGVPWRADGKLYVKPLGEGAELLTVSGRVTEAQDGSPVADAELDVWQADEHGVYDFSDAYHLRGKVKTDAEGRYRFETIVPAPYEIPKEGPTGELMRLLGRHHFRPAHIHMIVRVGGEERLVTQVFPAGGAYLDSDVAEAVKESLVVPMQPSAMREGRRAYTMEFDIALPPARVPQAADLARH